MVEAKTKAPQQWWLFGGHDDKDNTPRRSPWLQSTLSELDEKTKSMLRIIENDADSFAQRAEMYYRKRPELIKMIEDFYRAHKSLAERNDQVKSDAGFRHMSPWASPVSCKYRQEKSMMTFTDKSYDSCCSETYDDDPMMMESGDQSEVDDPEQEENQNDKEGGEEEEEEVSSEGTVNDEVTRRRLIREEIERLKGDNNILKEQLAEKDEEKREVIRQLSMAMDVLKEENVKLRKCIARESESPKKGKGSPPSEFHKLKRMFLGNLFNGSPKFTG